jgi:hypothetical protein
MLSITQASRVELLDYNELIKMWMKAMATSFKILFQNVTGGTEINHAMPQ